MVSKTIILTLLYIVYAIFSYAFADIFNMFEFLNTIFTTGVVIIFLRVLPILSSDDFTTDNPEFLYQMNKVGFLVEKTSFFMAMSVYCLCFRLLKLP